MRSDPAPGEKLLTKGEVAQLCRVEIRTVDRWITAGKMTYYRTPSGRLLFRARDVLMGPEHQQGRVVQSEPYSAQPGSGSRLKRAVSRPLGKRT